MKLIAVLVLVAVVGWVIRRKSAAPKTSSWMGGGSTGSPSEIPTRHNDGSVTPSTGTAEQ